MPIIQIRENESFDAAMRRFKRACEKEGVFTCLRRKEFYEKPTEKRKRKMAAAKKRHQKRVSKEQEVFRGVGRRSRSRKGERKRQRRRG